MRALGPVVQSPVRLTKGLVDRFLSKKAAWLLTTATTAKNRAFRPALSIAVRVLEICLRFRNTMTGKFRLYPDLVNWAFKSRALGSSPANLKSQALLCPLPQFAPQCSWMANWLGFNQLGFSSKFTCTFTILSLLFPCPTQNSLEHEHNMHTAHHLCTLRAWTNEGESTRECMRVALFGAVIQSHGLIDFEHVQN